jgi:hypothetical protein
MGGGEEGRGRRAERVKMKDGWGKGDVLHTTGLPTEGRDGRRREETQG